MPPSNEASKDETVEGRIAAVTHLSAARALIDCAAEALEEHGVMFVPERATTIHARIRGTRAALDLLADEIMEACEISNVLQTIEEVLATGEEVSRERDDGVKTVFHGAFRLTRWGRETILRAMIDARLAANEDEREPTDDEIYNRPGMEGGIGYPMFDTRDEHDPSL